MSNATLDQIKDAAFGTFSRLKDRLNAQNPEHPLTANEEKLITRETIKRHLEHLKKHNVQQGQLDPFKFICWAGGSLLDSLWHSDPVKWGVAIDVILDTLEDVLNKASRGKLRMPRNTRHLLRKLLLAEKQGEERHGIGMNGLYMSFHCCALLNPNSFGMEKWDLEIGQA